MVVNGWRLYVHPLFDQQFRRLAEQVEALAASDPVGYKNQPAARLLATINRHIREIILRDPGAAAFRQGNTLGSDNRHWFRVKFHERYRLFYRFSSKERVIIYAWVNDEHTLRKAGSRTDPYHVFRAMLEAARQNGGTDHLQIDEDAVSQHLYTRHLPDPDLVVRTSGEMRLSNFLLWQIAYAELYVTETLWPDFTRAELLEAILDFQRRNRRFGGLSPAPVEDHPARLAAASVPAR